MQKSNVTRIKRTLPVDHPIVGSIATIDEDGRVWVDYEASPDGPQMARLCDAVCAKLSQIEDLSQTEILIVFENGRQDRPLVIDVIQNTLKKPLQEKHFELVGNENDEILENVQVNGQQISFNAEEQIVLRCGKSSITLTRSGKVLIRGEYVLNRSTGVNHIRGGAIRIN